MDDEAMTKGGQWQCWCFCSPQGFALPSPADRVNEANSHPIFSRLWDVPTWTLSPLLEVIFFARRGKKGRGGDNWTLPDPIPTIFQGLTLIHLFWNHSYWPVPFVYLPKYTELSPVLASAAPTVHETRPQIPIRRTNQFGYFVESCRAYSMCRGRLLRCQLYFSHSDMFDRLE